MKSFQVRVGGFYVNERKGLVREITHEARDGNVHWRSYNLQTGSPTGDSLMCSPAWVLKWADREATPEETARLKRSDAGPSGEAQLHRLIEFVIKNIPDDQLFAEVRRRGHRVI
jgi:hypothetical protein